MKNTIDLRREKEKRTCTFCMTVMLVVVFACGSLSAIAIWRSFDLSGQCIILGERSGLLIEPYNFPTYPTEPLPYIEEYPYVEFPYIDPAPTNNHV